MPEVLHCKPTPNAHLIPYLTWRLATPWKVASACAAGWRQLPPTCHCPSSHLTIVLKPAVNPVGGVLAATPSGPQAQTASRQRHTSCAPAEQLFTRKVHCRNSELANMFMKCTCLIELIASSRHRNAFNTCMQKQQTAGRQLTNALQVSAESVSQATFWVGCAALVGYPGGGGGGPGSDKKRWV